MHGEDESNKVKDCENTFGGERRGEGLPEIMVRPEDLDKGIKIIDFLSRNKIMSSKSEARRAILNKGLKIEDEVITDEEKLLEKKDFKNKGIKISFGKKKHFLAKII